MNITSKISCRLHSLFRWFRLFFGFAIVPEICEASKGNRDYHDYHIQKGGDGVPSHFHTYECWHCGKRFEI